MADVSNPIQRELNTYEISSRFQHSLNDPRPNGSLIVPRTNGAYPGSYPRIMKFQAPGSAIVYDSLRDPALQDFFARTSVQHHLMKNGWFASNAICTICNTRGGAIKICQTCASFYHNFCLPPKPLTVSGVHTLIIHSSSNGSRATAYLQTSLKMTTYFSRVDELDTRKFKPTAELIDKYHSVLVITNGAKWAEPEGLGDLLSDYVHVRKGGVVLVSTNHKEALGGRWRKYRVSPLLPGKERIGVGLGLGKIEIAKHPLIAGLESFGDSGITAGHAAAALNESGGTLVARWSNGQPLVAVLDDHPTVDRGRVVSLNFALKLDKKAENETLTAAESILLANSLRFVAEPTYHKKSSEFTCDDCLDKISRGISPCIPQHANHHHSESGLPSGKSLYKYNHHLAEPAGSPQRLPVSRHATLDLLRTRVMNDVNLLKGLYRQRFKDQIAWSVERKYHVDKRSISQDKNQNISDEPDEESEKLPPINAKGEGVVVSGGSRRPSRPSSSKSNSDPVSLPSIIRKEIPIDRSNEKKLDKVISLH
ncbi:hypothetical protein HK096_001537 [Nowakowskiella sp. JEL0078]|nr:hypothetical protein HK096_001537 [Nowakowskiella sp. JEL0078]